MDERPKIKIQPTTQDKVLETAGIALLAVFWLMIIFMYFTMPDVIPIHFDVSGKPDGYGGRKTLFILPVIATLQFIIITEVCKYPEMFNYPVKITPENAVRQYGNALRMMRVLKVVVLLIFCVVEFSIYQAAATNESLDIWLLPILVFLIIVPMGYYIYKAYKNK